MGSVIGDARHLPWARRSVQAVVTSPPYWGQRDYGFDAQIGKESQYTGYVDALVAVGRELRDTLTDDGCLWLNLGDTYNTRAVIRSSSHQAGLGHDKDGLRKTWVEHAAEGNVRYSARQPGLKDKDLMGLPWRVANAFVADGWFLRCDVIWSKPVAMPENAPDRPTRRHEYLFMLTPNRRYWYDKEACPEGRGSVWEIGISRGTGVDAEHRAVFPDELVRRCVMLSTRLGDVVADPFAGSGTTQRVAQSLGRVGVGLDGRCW